MTLGNCPNLDLIEDSNTGIRKNEKVAIQKRITECRYARRSGRSLPDQLLGAWPVYAGSNDNLSFLFDQRKYNIEQQGTITEWLNRLERCQVFVHKRNELAVLVCKILATLNPAHKEYSSDFKDAFFVKIGGSPEQWDDRPSMLLNMINTDFMMYTAHEGETDRETAIERRMGEKMDQLKKKYRR